MRKIFNKVKLIYRKGGALSERVTKGFWNSNFIVVLSTIPLYYVCKLSKAETIFISVSIIAFTFLKCGFFILYSLEKIAETHTHNKSFNWYLIRFTNVFFLLILSFGIDNLLLFYNDNTSFNGVKQEGLFALIFDFCHYSFMTFTTVGFGEITAASRIAKFYSALEVFTGFVFVGYILSGFSSIKEAIIKDKFPNIEKKNIKNDNSDELKE